MSVKWMCVAIGTGLGLAACSEERSSIECIVPTYDLPRQRLAPSEARHLASMCTESWAKRWAVQSKESAGDIADATIAECMITYTTQANAEWPSETWGPGASLENTPKLVAGWRGVAVRQVIRTREDGCRELVPLPKYVWVSQRQPSKR